MHNQISHNLESVAVRRGLDQLLAAVRKDYRGVIDDLECGWDGDTLHVRFRAYGYPIESSVHVGDHVLEWDGYVPTSAAIVRTKLQRTIETKLNEMLRSGARRAA
jgi:hypothetical protein